MMKRLCILILALACTLSCNRREENRDEQLGLCVNLSTSGISVGTKAGDGIVSDGGGVAFDAGLPDIVILVANSSGTIVKRYPGTGAELVAGATATDMSVVFSGLDGGSYTIYAFGNTAGLWDMELADGSDPRTSVSYEELTSSKLSTVEDVENLQFQEHFVHPGFHSTAPPDPLEVPHRLEVRNGRLPLSAKAEGVIVSADHNGHAELDLLRCVAKVTVEFQNLEEEDLLLKDCWFRIMDICPCRGFVTPHGGHTMPDDAHIGTLVDQTHSEYTLRKDVPFSRSFYVHPCTAPMTEPAPGYFTMTVGLQYHDENGDPLNELFPDMPIFSDHREDIKTLDRNEHLHIVCTVAAGHDVSFNFEVVDWEAHTETVHFD